MLLLLLMLFGGRLWIMGRLGARQRITVRNETRNIRENTHIYRHRHRHTYVESVERAKRDKWLKASVLVLVLVADTSLSRFSISVGRCQAQEVNLLLLQLKFSHKQKQILRTCAIYIAKQLSLENAARTKTLQTKGAQGSGSISISISISICSSSLGQNSPRTIQGEAQAQLQLSHVSQGAAATSVEAAAFYGTAEVLQKFHVMHSKQRLSSPPREMTPLHLSLSPYPYFHLSLSFSLDPKNRRQIRKRASCGAN